jgi:hypothetical protein
MGSPRFHFFSTSRKAIASVVVMLQSSELYWAPGGRLRYINAHCMQQQTKTPIEEIEKASSAKEHRINLTHGGYDSHSCTDHLLTARSCSPLIGYHVLRELVHPGIVNLTHQDVHVSKPAIKQTQHNKMHISLRTT